MTGCLRLMAAVLVTAVSIDLQAQVNDPAHQHEASTRVEGPLVTLRSVLQEALDRNPELVALRDQIAVARQRPAQERTEPARFAVERAIAADATV